MYKLIFKTGRDGNTNKHDLQEKKRWKKKKRGKKNILWDSMVGRGYMNGGKKKGEKYIVREGKKGEL